MPVVDRNLSSFLTPDFGIKLSGVKVNLVDHMVQAK